MYNNSENHPASHIKQIWCH